ncbi:ephrin type-A receptor 3-like [Centropristis striata]|uniref:ephrin type-A receptor 3-like n=1 Tax=Centropristis striata TaxID=184440 RepID=UPI0027DFEBC1|nr:ephrin type-A receptor 3-like [Centropristis striata]
MAILWCVCSTIILSWIWTREASCDVHYKAEEVEIFHSDKQTLLGWTSNPLKEWTEIKLGTQTKVPVLQACGKKIKRTILSQWMERKDAHYLLMDISVAQEEETSGQLSPLQVHILDTDTRILRFQNRNALDLPMSEPFPVTVPHNQIWSHLNRSLALSLGSVSRRGFQLAFSYSGSCALIASIRIYYRRCPDIVDHLALFNGTGALSDLQMGSCVKGAVEVLPPVRECQEDGVWGPLQGGCTCEPGHQVVMEDTCQACRMGFYKPANETAACQLCPPNTRTHAEGSESCDCLKGFRRLPSDPDHLGCTKPPSAPVNLTAHHHNDSLLIMTWDPPHDWGGRQEVTYCIKCQKKADAGNQWEACGEDVVFLSNSTVLTNTSVSITQLNPQHDYRFSVQARNDISNLWGAPPSSTATFTMHRWKIPPVVITVVPSLNISEPEGVPAPQHKTRFSIWLTVGILFGVLVLIAIIPIVVCVLRSNYSKLR